MALFSPTTTEFSNVTFAPEAIQALSRELGNFQGVQQPAERGQMQSLLGLLQQQGPTSARASAPGYSPLRDTLALAPSAMEHAGASRGVHTPEFANAVDTLHTSMPQLLELLRQHAVKSAGETQSLIDPRFAQFLAPNVLKSSTTDPGAGTTALTALGTALQLAGLGSKFDWVKNLFKSNPNVNTLGDASGQGDPYGSTSGGEPIWNDPSMYSDYQQQIDLLNSGGYGADFGTVY